MKRKALIVVTSHDKLGDTDQKTGWFLSEVSHVYWPLHTAGIAVDFASPLGGQAPMEETSLKLDDAENNSFVNKFGITNSISTQALKDIDPNNYSIIYFAGGHGAMWDFPNNPDVERITRSIYENDGIIAAVCHGPAALTSVQQSDGTYLVAGKQVSSFTNDEEREVKKVNIVPFLLERRLRERGALFEAAPNWADKVITDERLVTGQNPQSASSLGKAIVKLFNELELGFGRQFDDRDSLHWVVQT